MSYSVLKNSHLVTVHKKIHYSRNIYIYVPLKCYTVTNTVLYSWIRLHGVIFPYNKSQKMYVYIVRHSYYTKYLICCVGNIIYFNFFLNLIICNGILEKVDVSS